MQAVGKLSLLTLAVASSLLFSASASAKDGVYQATTLGRNGDMTVQVTVKNDKIADVKVLDWSETHPIADLPKSKIPADIVANQSVNVDIVSGATLTSFALKKAVEDCLQQAGLDLNKFSKPVKKAPLETGTVTEQTDVVIVGAGGAGLSAAVAAAQKGKKVIIIEKNHYAGGNTSVSGGCYNAADPQTQSSLTMTEGERASVEKLLAQKPLNELHGQLLAKIKKQWEEFNAKGGKGMFDSPELHAVQTWYAGDLKGDLSVVYTLTQNTVSMKDFLASIGVKWQPKATQFVGALWPRSQRASNFKSGVGYVDTFFDLIKEKKYPVTFYMSTPAQDLIVKDGRVVGVKAKSQNGKTLNLIAKDGVILTSGGFGANVAMRQKYDTLWNKTLDEKVKTTNLPSITGDGINMALKLGAATVDMGYIQLLPTTDPYTGATNHKVAEGTCIYVNKDGNRFVNELERRDVLAKAGLAQKDHVFYVISTTKTNLTDKDGRNPYGIKVADLLRQHKTFTGKSLDDLAKAAGINAENLKKTVASWNEFCKVQTGDKFGRSTCLPEHRLDEGPYWATIMTPSVHHTMGGLKINSKTQVMNVNGKPIEGLYAAGEITGGIHGTNRVGCNAVPDALVFGRIAGTEVGSK